MKIPGLLLLRWSKEADAELLGMACRRVLQPADSTALVLHLTGRRDRFLLLPGGRDVPTPCWFDELGLIDDLLGAHRPTEKFNRLPRRRLAAISGYPGDRRLAFRFTARPESPDDGELVLIAHLIGPAPLCLLTDHAGRICGSDRQSDRFPVGTEYRPPPPPSLLDPITLTFPEFLKAWRSETDRGLIEFLRSRIWGIDEELAETLISGVNGGKLTVHSTDGEIWEVLARLKTKIRGLLDVRQTLTIDPDTGRIDCRSLPPSPRTGSSVNDLICARLKNHVQALTLGTAQQTWQKYAAAQLKKIQAAQSALQARRNEAENAETFKQCADILSIHRTRMHKGVERIELPDPYHDGNPVTILLNPAKSVQDNIEAYYKKHRRALSAQSALAKEQARLDVAERLVREIAERAQTSDFGEQAPEIEVWRARLEKIGLPPPQKPSPVRRATVERRLPYREFILAGGEVVWVGRSARENDELTLKLAAKTDWFLHAAQNAGAHVILKHGQRESAPSVQALRRAAVVAAFFSEAKHSSVVAVSYTPVKYVRKPRKAPPGRVALIHAQTLLVAPGPPPGYHDKGESG